MPRPKVYTSREKLQILDDITYCRDILGESLQACCELVGVQPSQVRRRYMRHDDLSTPEAANRACLSSGMPSFLKCIKTNFLAWFCERRDQGFIATVRLCILKACELNPEYRRKTMRSKDLMTRRFLKANKIVLRAITHECQRPPEAVQSEALQLMAYARSKVSQPGRDQRLILNMDQTPTFFDMLNGRTLDRNGVRTVKGRSTTSSTLRATVAVTVTASGEMLKNFVIFKGKPNA